MLHPNSKDISDLDFSVDQMTQPTDKCEDKYVVPLRSSLTPCAAPAVNTFDNKSQSHQEISQFNAEETRPFNESVTDSNLKESDYDTSTIA